MEEDQTFKLDKYILQFRQTHFTMRFIRMSDHDNHAEQSDQSIDAKQTHICHPPSLPAARATCQQSPHARCIFLSPKLVILIYDISLQIDI